MNVEIRAEAPLFPEKEYISRTFVAVRALGSPLPVSILTLCQSRRSPYARVDFIDPSQALKIWPLDANNNNKEADWGGGGGVGGGGSKLRPKVTEFLKLHSS